jgi:23S rRNA (pseudouridine1915-N3)-methyltransferase
MKFDAVTEEQWHEWDAYVDTVLIPWSALCGSEMPWEMHARLALVRDVMMPIERAFAGRVLTVPAVHYGMGDVGWHGVVAVARMCRARGAAFVVVAAPDVPTGSSFGAVDVIVCADGAYVDTGSAWVVWEQPMHPLVALWNASIV